MKSTTNLTNNDKKFLKDFFVGFFIVNFIVFNNDFFNKFDYTLLSSIVTVFVTFIVV